MPLIVLDTVMHSGCKLKGIRKSVVVATRKKIPILCLFRTELASCHTAVPMQLKGQDPPTPAPKVYISLGVSEDSSQLSEEQGQITHGHYDKTRPTYPVYY